MEIDWHRAPLVRLAIPFIAGSALAWKLANQIGLVLPMLSMLCAFLLLFICCLLYVFRKQWKFPAYSPLFAIIVSVGFVILGFGITLPTLERTQRALPELPYCDQYQAVVESPPIRKAKTIAYRVGIKSGTVEGKHILLNEISVLVYIKATVDSQTYQQGDTLILTGRLQRPAPALNPGSFDYAAYLRKQGIVATIYLADPPEYHKGIPPMGVLAWFKNIQQYGSGKFHELGIKNDELGVASALILGERNLLEADVRDSFTQAGVVHILAVSGLHVGLIFVVISWLLIKLFPKQKYAIVRTILAITFLWIYAGVTGFSPSVLRAATMFSFIAVGRTRGSATSIYNMMAASAMILLIVNPLLICEVGFQLSYLAVLGILILHKPIYSLIQFKPWILDKTWSLLVVSFTAQLATFPLTTYYFGQFPTYFLLANLFVIPIATGILYVGLSLLALSWLPLVNHTVAWIFNKLLQSLLILVEYTTRLPGSKISNLYMDQSMVLLFYLLLIGVISAMAWPNRLYLRLAQLIVIAFVLIGSTRNILNAQRQESWLLSSPAGAVPVILDGSHAFIALIDTSHRTNPNVERSISGFMRMNQVRALHYQTDIETQKMGWKMSEIAITSGTATILFDSYDFGTISDSIQTKLLLLAKERKAMELSPNIKVVLDNRMSFYTRREWQAETSQTPIWDLNTDGALRLD